MLKNSFVLYVDQYPPIAALSLEQKGMLLDAFFRCNGGKDVTIPDPVAAMAFSFFRQTFDRDSEKYAKKCEKNRENAYKRYAGDAMAPDRMRPSANPADTGSVSDTGSDTGIESASDTDTDTDPRRRKRRGAAGTPTRPRRSGTADGPDETGGPAGAGERGEAGAPVGQSGQSGQSGRSGQSGQSGRGKADADLSGLIMEYSASPALREALEGFCSMREQMKKPLTAHALRLILKQLDTLAPDDAGKTAVVEQSIMRSWQGVFPVDAPRSGAQSFKSAAQRRLEANVAAGQEAKFLLFGGDDHMPAPSQEGAHASAGF